MSSSGTSKDAEAAGGGQGLSSTNGDNALHNGKSPALDEDEAMDSGVDEQQQAAVAQPALHLTSDEVNYLIFRCVQVATVQ
jgi:hypothetical protein